MNSDYKNLRQILGLVLLVLTQSQSFAVTRETTDLTTGKALAPSKDDYDHYAATPASSVSAADLKKADVLRLKTIKSINAILSEKKKTKQQNEFELTLRLAELYAERFDYIRDLELDEYNKNFLIWQKIEAKNRSIEPKLTYKKSEGELNQTIAVLRKLVAKFPKHPRSDAALYALAKAMSRIQDDASIKYYELLVKNHPQSPFIPDAYLAMGEYFFDKHKIPQAIDSYQKVMKYKDHKSYPYAIYKLGWAFYNSDPSTLKYEGENYKKAIASFKLVVKISSQSKLHAAFDLREEAIKDLIMVWADAEDIDGAWKYFQTIGEKQRFYTMLERLGNIYMDQGKNDKSIEVYTRLLSESPLRPNNPQIYAKVVQLQDLTNNFTAEIESLKIMSQLYLGSSEWVTAQGLKKDTLLEGRQTVAKTLHRQSTLMHDRGQKSRNEKMIALASSGYEIYLKNFADEPAAYDLRFYLAEIQYDQKKYEAASNNYLLVAKANAKGKNFKAALLNSVSTLASLNETSKFAALPEAGKVPEPIELPRVKSLYIDRIDQFVTMSPTQPEGFAMRYTAAQILFDYGHYAKAEERFAKIIKEIPNTKQALASAKVILGYHAERGHWEEVIKYGKSFQQVKALASNEDFKKFSDQVLKQALFTRALAFEKNSKFADAALGFIEFKKAFPADPNADRALYNASQNYFKLGRLEDSLVVSKVILDEYPNSKLAPDVVASMGETYEALTLFDRAAESYVRLVTMFPQDRRSAIALFNSGTLYKGLKKYDESVASFTKVVKLYPQSQYAHDAHFQIGEIKLAKDDKNGALAAYTEFLKKDDVKDDQYWFAFAKTLDLKTQLGKTETAQKDLWKITRALTRKDAPGAFEARHIVSEIIFKAQEGTVRNFKNVSLENGDQIEAQLKKKQKRLEFLAAQFDTIMSLGDGEYLVASLYRLGELHENFAQSLMTAKPPSSATQAQANKFKSTLDQLAFPLREEANKFYETAYKRSQEIETFTAWTQKAYAKVAEMQPKKYPEIAEDSLAPTYVTRKLSLTESTDMLAH